MKRPGQRRAAGVLGIAPWAIQLLLFAAPAAAASQVTITVTGTLSAEDYLGIFGTRRVIPDGTPFMLVYTFDDSKGQALHRGNCADSGSGIVGSGQASARTVGYEDIAADRPRRDTQRSGRFHHQDREIPATTPRCPQRLLRSLHAFLDAPGVGELFANAAGHGRLRQEAVFGADKEGRGDLCRQKHMMV